MKTLKLADTANIEEFVTAVKHPVRNKALVNPEEWERILRARLIVEEAFELVEALGLKVSISGEDHRKINPKEITYVIDAEATYDIVETLDALGDLIVVTKGAGLQFGVPVDNAVLGEIGPSNMSKLGPDRVAKFDSGNKVIKPETFREPDIKSVLDTFGYIARTDFGERPAVQDKNGNWSAIPLEGDSGTPRILLASETEETKATDETDQTDKETGQ